MKKNLITRTSGVIAAAALAVSLVSANTLVSAYAEGNDAKVIYTDYADLWTSADITAEAGTTVKWYVVVPEDTEPKGCGATIKIPGLGFGTDTHNKEEGHIVLQKGENFIYEFTPETEGDILFTCWMGSGCHKNYIHVSAAPVSAESSAAEESSSESPESEAVTDESSAAESVAKPEVSSEPENVSSAAQVSAAGSTVSTSSASKNDSSSSSDSKSTTNTSSNPKTGSSFGGQLTVIGLLGSALCVIAGKNRKR